MPSSLTSPRTRLYLFSLVSRLLILCLVYISSFLPVFDSGAHAVLQPSTLRLTSALLRWDVFHFSHIANEGYVYEYEWAFFPGIAGVMRYAGQLLGLLKSGLGIGGSDMANILQGGAMAAMACDSTMLLYDLSLEVFGSQRIAYLCALLSLIPSSPATLRYAPYTEPFFTYLSYKGMLASLRSRYLHAAAFFAVATTFRSNGVLLAGYIVWPVLVQPLLRHERPRLGTLGYAASLSLIVASPLVLYQASAYRLFCFSSSPPLWCSSFPPSIYAYVQAEYWDNGFLHYWHFSQVPNFLMAAPVYAIIFAFCWFHLSRRGPNIYETLLRETGAAKASSDPFLNAKLTPFVIHSFVLTSTLLLASHVQIILRIAPSMPVVYWAAVWLLVRNNTSEKRPLSEQQVWNWGKMWVWWSVVWGAVSTVLWTTGLPPA
ncbi:mannosyltransferase [Heliocybe sulcata]|uniref:GPI mannosyltransferase 2 n=1 Tax=Heliocybe sulcata TaxID=5364 RepID=A0A5C3MSM5_9AGAM|nr:mannosyltransferase [Heliocybe sulcata]